MCADRRRRVAIPESIKPLAIACVLVEREILLSLAAKDGQAAVLQEVAAGLRQRIKSEIVHRDALNAARRVPSWKCENETCSSPWGVFMLDEASSQPGYLELIRGQLPLLDDRYLTSVKALIAGFDAFTEKQTKDIKCYD